MLFSIIKSLRPDLFEFEILDFSTSKGIDALCSLEPAYGGLQKGNLRYVEFKRALTHEFRDHTFARRRLLFVGSAISITVPKFATSLEKNEHFK